ncbi:unnamed protein product [Rhizophagus irregularis]|nr:unnamed protein product [Rhizophagus irregularis]CAB4434856.1 unnamed protein product [Rhizophagus irregularis]
MEEEKKNAIRLEEQFQVSVSRNLCNYRFACSSYPWNFVFAWLWTSPPLLQLPIELRLRMVMDFASAVDSKKMGRLDNFWLKSLPRSKHRNVADNKEINTENVFLSCDLTCDEIQISGSSNVIRGNKRSYENRKQSGIEETRRGKKQKPVKTTTIEVDKGRTPERQRRVDDKSSSSAEEKETNSSLFSPSDYSNSDVGVTHEGDHNPFIAQTGEGSTKYKVVLSWSHAIDDIAINNISENDVSIRNVVCVIIWCLSSIMYCGELKTEYIKCSEKTWNQVHPRVLILKELPTVADLVIIEYNRLLSNRQSLNTKWRNNWAKGNELLTEEDKDIFDCVQMVARNLYTLSLINLFRQCITYLSSVSYNENKKMDEDTFVHQYCHQILKEIFNKAEFSLVWANGESESSKERRLLDGYNYGRKPDFRILVNIEETDKELIFGEIKPPHCTIAVNQCIIKLAEFMKGSLDYLINVYGYVAGLETYGILICGSEIKIFSTDLTYDGLYRCNLISKVLLPTENANFLNIITVVSTLYSLLERVKSTINTIISSQLPTGSSLNCHSYCRKSNSSPKKMCTDSITTILLYITIIL